MNIQNPSPNCAPPLIEDTVSEPAAVASAVEMGQMSSAETGQMSAVETGQMSAAETGQMSAVETRQMSTIATGRCPVLILYICLVSAAGGRQLLCLLFRKALACPVRAVRMRKHPQGFSWG